jgi:protein SCO1/2
MGRVPLALWLAVAVVLAGAGALALGAWQSRLTAGDVAASGAALGGAFSLVDQNGAPATEALLRDKPTALFFGYTHCPDVCPTTLMETSSWINELGGDGEKMRFVFVTIDPARDTPAVLKEYLSAFSPKIIGISGPPDKVEAMARDYKIYFSKSPGKSGDYAMDHAASVLLLDEKGGLVGTIAPGEQHETALGKLRRLVAG